MQSKYFNDAIVGNSKIKATFTKKGEMIRLLYGAADYKQFLEKFYTGVKINDSQIIYLHDDINNVYSQKYKENTNILETQIFNTYFKTRIIQTDFVPIDEKVLIKKYVIKNENTIDLNINFLVYSKIMTNLNNDTSGFIKEDALIQYNHDFSVCTFSAEKLYGKQVNDSINTISTGIIGGKDYIGMSNDSAISYELKTIRPGEECNITLYIYINKNKENDVINEINSQIERIKEFDINKLELDTEEYWKRYLKEHDKMQINDRKLSQKIKDIYNRTILLFPLLINEKTGGISAGMEVDEYKNKCGRYSYCWPRDAVFITEALDIVGMNDISEKFYSNFCKKTQSKNGMWEQRFYTDGRLAPCWGYQIDETASVIFGAYNHYQVCKNKTFLKDNLQMLENGITFLEEYICDILNGKNKFQKSYDLWEMFEGNSLYSVSSIYAAFISMVSIYKILKEDLNENEAKLNLINEQIAKLEKLSENIKEYCIKTFYDENRKSYVRNLDDRRMDVSIIGSITPFKMLETDDSKVKNTIEQINNSLRTYTGGYIRFENDGYLGGCNPWPIATLWMSWYYIEAGDIDKALECFYFVVNSASEHSFLGEQVNNSDMKPMWVIGLTWSHAMYIITLQKLLDVL